MTSRNRPRRLPLRPLQPPPEPQDAGRGEAAIWRWLHKAVVEDVAPEPLDAEMAANLATLLLVVLTENARHQLGVEPEQARAAALGWIAAKAQTREGDN
jgi:hypothetical protein